MRDELSKISGAKLAIVFGSVAKGDYRSDSDIDILLVADDSASAKRIARKISSNIFAETGVPVTVVVVSSSDYLSEQTSLIKRTRKEERFILWKG